MKTHAQIDAQVADVEKKRSDQRRVTSVCPSERVPDRDDYSIYPPDVDKPNGYADAHPMAPTVKQFNQAERWPDGQPQVGPAPRPDGLQRPFMAAGRYDVGPGYDPARSAPKPVTPTGPGSFSKAPDTGLVTEARCE